MYYHHNGSLTSLNLNISTNTQTFYIKIYSGSNIVIKESLNIIK